jgi:hypothetical protein
MRQKALFKVKDLSDLHEGVHKASKKQGCIRRAGVWVSTQTCTGGMMSHRRGT